MTKENNKNSKRSRPVAMTENFRQYARSFRSQMEQNLNSSTVFPANQCIVCINDLEMEITRENCTIKGRAAILPLNCCSGIMFQSFTENGGVKLAQFIIPEHVPTRGDMQPARAAAAPSPPPPPASAAAAPSPPPPPASAAAAPPPPPPPPASAAAAPSPPPPPASAAAAPAPSPAPPPPPARASPAPSPPPARAAAFLSPAKLPHIPIPPS